MVLALVFAWKNILSLRLSACALVRPYTVERINYAFACSTLTTHHEASHARRKKKYSGVAGSQRGMFPHCKMPIQHDTCTHTLASATHMQSANWNKHFGSDRPEYRKYSNLIFARTVWCCVDCWWAAVHVRLRFVIGVPFFLTRVFFFWDLRFVYIFNLAFRATSALSPAQICTANVNCRHCCSRARTNALPGQRNMNFWLSVQWPIHNSRNQEKMRAKECCFVVIFIIACRQSRHHTDNGCSHVCFVHESAFISPFSNFSRHIFLYSNISHARLCVVHLYGSSAEL